MQFIGLFKRRLKINNFFKRRLQKATFFKKATMKNEKIKRKGDAKDVRNIN